MKTSVLFTEIQIKKSVSKIADNIRKEYYGNDICLLGVLNGCVPFLSDLMKELDDMKLNMETVKVESYHGTNRSKNVKLNYTFPLEKINNFPVIIVDDIYDSGNTLEVLRKDLSKYTNDIKYCCVVKRDKKEDSRLIKGYLQLETTNFVVGYGLDYNGYMRNSNCIYDIKEYK